MTLDTKKTIANIHLSGCNEGLSVLQRLAKESCEEVCLDDIHSNRIAVALDELFANIHAHGYGKKGGNIECTANWLLSEDKRCKLEITLRDFAPVIADISSCKGVCPESLKEHPVAGGLGMHLIGATTEKFEHTPLDDGNYWRLLFNVEKHKGSGS